MANGPLPKPSGMRNAIIDGIAKRAVPAYFSIFVFFGVTYVSNFYVQYICLILRI